MGGQAGEGGGGSSGEGRPEGGGGALNVEARGKGRGVGMQGDQAERRPAGQRRVVLPLDETRDGGERVQGVEAGQAAAVGTRAPMLAALDNMGGAQGGWPRRTSKVGTSRASMADDKVKAGTACLVGGVLARVPRWELRADVKFGAACRYGSPDAGRGWRAAPRRIGRESSAVKVPSQNRHQRSTYVAKHVLP